MANVELSYSRNAIEAMLRYEHYDFTCYIGPSSVAKSAYCLISEVCDLLLTD